MDFSNLSTSFNQSNSSKLEKNSNITNQTKQESESEYFNRINKIGILADIQYCDKDDGPNWNGTEFRRYRETLNVTKRAAQSFQKENVGAIIQLGDAIDGHSGENYFKDFSDVLSPILNIPPPLDIKIEPNLLPPSIPRLDVIGNHELYCCSRNKLKTHLYDYDPTKDRLSYSREIAGGKWRLIVLDSYAISWNRDLDLKKQEMSQNELKNFNLAKSILDQNNQSWLSSSSETKTICKEKERYRTFNGGVGQAQLEWLENQLDDAWNKRQFVAIFSHIPISGLHGNEYLWNSLHWDADDILQLIKRRGSHVVACIAGHRHSFSHRNNDENDTFTHHLVMPSPLLAPVGGEAHAIFEFSIRHGHDSDEIRDESDKKPTSIGESKNGMEKTSLNDIKSIGTIKVHGSGSMPKVIDLAKPAPNEWTKKS